MRFVSTGRSQTSTGFGNTTEEAQVGQENLQEQDEDMLDVETSVSSSLAIRSKESRPSTTHGEDFTVPEWQTIALGWRDVQNDIRHAAQSGVRVWRMKVCVVTMAI